MPEKQYNTTWYQPGEEPNIGMPCPKCEQGVLDISQYGGFWCKNCKWKWKQSKFPPKKIQVQRQGEKEFHEEVKKVEHNWEVEIIGRLDKLDERLTEMAKFLDKRLPPNK